MNLIGKSMTAVELDEIMTSKGFVSALSNTPEYEILESQYVSYPINDYERYVIYFEYDGELIKINKVVIE